MAGWPAANDPRDEFVVWKVEEHARAWILRFETRRWLDTRDFREQSIGACPFVVDKTRRQATDGLTSERARLCVEATVAGGRTCRTEAQGVCRKGVSAPRSASFARGKLCVCGAVATTLPGRRTIASCQESFVMVERRGFESRCETSLALM